MRKLQPNLLGRHVNSPRSGHQLLGPNTRDLKHVFLPLQHAHLCEEVCQLLVDLGSEGGARHADQSLPVHLSRDLHLLQDRQGLLLSRIEALGDDPGMDALGGDRQRSVQPSI